MVAEVHRYRQDSSWSRSLWCKQEASMRYHKRFGPPNPTLHRSDHLNPVPTLVPCPHSSSQGLLLRPPLKVHPLSGAGLFGRQLPGVALGSQLPSRVRLPLLRGLESTSLLAGLVLLGRLHFPLRGRIVAHLLQRLHQVVVGGGSGGCGSDLDRCI